MFEMQYSMMFHPSDVFSDYSYGLQYRDDSKNDAVKIQDTELLGAISALGQQIELIKAPQGKAKTNPARSCKDIFLNNVEAESGE